MKKLTSSHAAINPRDKIISLNSERQRRQAVPQQPGSFETHGVTAWFCRSMGELASNASCYAEDRIDAADLRDAAARFFDIYNRMERRAAEGGAHA